MAFREYEEKKKKENTREDLIIRINKRNAYVKCFNTDAGREVLLDLITKFELMDSPFSNSGWTAFSCGERNAVMYMAAQMPDIFYHALWQFGQSKVEELEKELAESKKEFDLE